MAGTITNRNQFNPQPYLDPNQQELLLAALASNNPTFKGTSFPSAPQSNSMANHAQNPQQPLYGNMNDSYFASPQQMAPMTNFDTFAIDDSPFLDGLDGDASFDYDFETGDQMIGSLPGDSPGKDGGSERDTIDGDIHDKRKIDDKDEVNGDNKRREGEDKTAKKPGRKPLTSEPTTKRKAQKRAAQRAFRERKEMHLRDLETQVHELTKASESANHENGLLRAQVARLQMELREYRKRLSLNTAGLGRSPPLSNGFSSYLGGVNNGSLSNNFQFEFPRFGGLPGNHILSNGLSAKTEQTKTASPKPTVSNSGPGVLTRHGSAGRSMSPKSRLNGSGTTSPAVNNVSNAPADSITGLYSPSLLNGLGANGSSDNKFPGTSNQETQSNRGSTDSTSGRSRTYNTNSTPSNSASPSDSSVSNYGGANSSCGTSPEPSHNSPGAGKSNDTTMDTINEQGYICHGNSEGEISFCEKLNMACGNPRNPIPRAMSQSNDTPAPATAKTAAANVNGIDWMANQNGGQFDPVLFGDYRESTAAIVGDGDFSSGFFNEAFGVPDFGSPFNLNNPTPAPKNNPMEEVERLQDGNDDEEVVPGEDVSQMLSCHKIWDKLQERQDFKEGNFDIDGLCSELRAKARCSESGVVVDQKDVDEALKRLP